MNRSVLFSPVGGTDPIANERDGSMLHICRKYKPDCVMLYLSHEMSQRHHKDDRYCDSLRRLAEREGFSPEILVEERPELSEVQVYDYFFQEFQPLLLNLHNRFPERQIIVNIASGTPAMKSALYLLAKFLNFPVLPVQTTTPVKAQNPRLEPHADYDAELYWEFNLDNEDYIDRCQEVQYENLNAQLQKENISAYLHSYDYAAALLAAKQVDSLLSPRALALLKAAKARMELNWQSIQPEIRLEFHLPVNRKNSHVDLVEYLLWLQAKQQRGDLADFLRGLTPGLFALMKLAAEEKAGYVLSRYCDDEDRFRRYQMEEDEQGREFLRLLERPGANINGTYLASSHYTKILENNCMEKPWAAPLIQLRDIERKARNSAAHTITRVDEAWLQKQHMPSSKEILKLIKDVVQNLDEDCDRKPSVRLAMNWKAYENMNQKIKEALGEIRE